TNGYIPIRVRQPPIRSIFFVNGINSGQRYRVSTTRMATAIWCVPVCLLKHTLNHKVPGHDRRYRNDGIYRKRHGELSQPHGSTGSHCRGRLLSMEERE